MYVLRIYESNLLLKIQLLTGWYILANSWQLLRVIWAVQDKCVWEDTWIWLFNPIKQLGGNFPTRFRSSEVHITSFLTRNKLPEWFSWFVIYTSSKYHMTDHPLWFFYTQRKFFYKFFCRMIRYFIQERLDRTFITCASSYWKEWLLNNDSKYYL